ncbi:MAG: hypothetical protein ACRD0K_25780, partial [Egibacteraceae bacterium]
PGGWAHHACETRSMGPQQALMVAVVALTWTILVAWRFAGIFVHQRWDRQDGLVLEEFVHGLHHFTSFFKF